MRQFAKLDLGYFDNPKVADFVEDHPHVPLLHLRAILYCRQHLTDGRFPVRLVARMASASYCGSHCDSECDYCRAVEAGLLTRVDGKTGEVHDYLEHQQSSEDVARLSNAGKKGAAARWKSGSDADRNADGIPDGNAEANAEREEREERESTGRKRPTRAIPTDWMPTAKHQAYADENRLDLGQEAFRFRNHAHQVDRRCANWNAAFTNWLSKAKPAPKQASNDNYWSNW
jgi:hypothetical protein